MFLATHSDVPFLTQPQWATAVGSSLRASMWHSAGTGSTDWALSSWKQCTCITLIQWTNAVNSQPSMYVSTGKCLHSSPGAPCLEPPRQTSSNFCELSGTAAPPWNTGGTNLNGFSSPCSKAATKTTLASSKLAPANSHSTEITYRIACYTKLYLNNQQGIEPLLANCIQLFTKV